MVHALHEAHRVLKPDGVLLDLRPSAKHRRVGLGEGADWQLVGAMREKFDDDFAANAAVREVLHNGLFFEETRFEFDVERVMDTMDDFHAWIDEFVRLADFPSHAWLIRRVERARNKQPENKIVVRGPLQLGVLKKMSL